MADNIELQYVGIRRSDNAAMGHAGRIFPGYFPKFFDSKSGVAASCAQQVKWYNRDLNSRSSYPRDPKTSLLPGDIVDVFEIEFALDQNGLHASQFKPVGSLLFDDQKKKPGMRWL